MEIKNMRTIYLPDMESPDGVPTYTVVKDKDGLHWAPDLEGRKCGFELPFINEGWMIMESSLEEDADGNEIFEMDVIEVEGYYQKYFVAIRNGYTFSLFDGHSGLLNDPQGQVWKECKIVCPIWETSKIQDFSLVFNMSKVSSKF